MQKIITDSIFFNAKDTLYCGQFFAAKPYEQGYVVRSKNKFCYLYEQGDKTIFECENEDEEYFKNFFDLNFDYKACYDKAISFDIGVLTKSAKVGKGIRILNQDKFETLTEFVISQNNNIPRIRNSLEYICKNAGEKKSFMGEEYFCFPSLNSLSKLDTDFFVKAGLGYRAPYLKGIIALVKEGLLDLSSLSVLPTEQLKAALMDIKGVGAKVASCVTLFAYHRLDSFPVDTWIEKLYLQDFNGKETDRQKISAFFCEKFGSYAGIIQQYLFHYKRNLEKESI